MGVFDITVKVAELLAFFERLDAKALVSILLVGMLMVVCAGAGLVKKLAAPTAEDPPLTRVESSIGDVTDSTVAPAVTIQQGEGEGSVVAPVTVQQADGASFQGGVNVSGKDQTIVQVETLIGTQINYEVVRDDEDLKVTRAAVAVTLPDNQPGEVDVWVLWKGASWHSGETSFNRRPLEEFFTSSAYRAAIRNANAIGCIGLVSSWMKPELQIAPDRDEIMHRLSDRRARILCAEVAEQARELDAQPLLFGAGLGFNTLQAADLQEDRKQRALILIHVATTHRGRPANKDEVRMVVRQFLQRGAMTDFTPQEYSEVEAERPLPWFAMEEGMLLPDEGAR